MGIVKVILNGVTKMDITPTTADASEVNQGEVFFNRSGEQSVGTGDPPSTRVPVNGLGKNLLDNWYLLNPVNQRGKSSYTTSGYTIDRWTNQRNDVVSLESSGVRLTYASSNTYHQLAQIVPYVERFYGKTVTFSALLETTVSCYLRIDLGNGGDVYSSVIPANSSGLVSVTTQVPSTTNTMTVAVTSGSTAAASGSFTIKAVKLELGDEQTLAHQENSTWVLNEVPVYEDELLMCQRYLYLLPRYHTIRATAIRTNAVYFSLPVPIPMAKEPTLLNDSNLSLQTLTGTGATGFSFSVSQYNGPYIQIAAEKTSHGMSDAVLSFGTVTPGVFLNAEL